MTALSTSHLLALGLGAALAGCRAAPASERPHDAPAPSAAPRATSSPAPAASAAKACAATCLDIERCDADRGVCVPACPEGEVYVPPTESTGFVMGRSMSAFAFGPVKSHNTGSGVADTPHRVVLTKPFCIDATEVTGAAYATCVDEGACKMPKFERWLNYRVRPDHPINMVDWNKATTYCAHVGKSLPSEAQWEWAATGGDGRTWPWGDEAPTCERADFTPGIVVSPGGDMGCHGGGTSPVGAHPAGDKIWPTGSIHDLAGNVWEWCIDAYLPYPAHDEVDPVARGSTGNHVIRGGGWNRSARGIQAVFRGAAVVTYQVPGLGFRCVRNAATAPGPSRFGADGGADAPP